MVLGWFSSRRRTGAGNGADTTSRDDLDTGGMRESDSDFERLSAKSSDQSSLAKRNRSKNSDTDRSLSFSERMRAVETQWYTEETPGHLPRYNPETSSAAQTNMARTNMARTNTPARGTTSSPAAYGAGHLHKAHQTAAFADRHGAGAGYGYGQGDGTGGRGRSVVGDLTRLGAALFTAGIFGLMIANPVGGGLVVKRLAGANPLTTASLSSKACRAGQPVLSNDFTAYENVLSISPLGGVTAPGEILPVPYIRINTKNDGSPFNRRATDALAPATADVVAIERRLSKPDGDGAPVPAWTVYMQPCAGVQIVYDRLDSLSPLLIEKAGGLAGFSEIGGPDHIAKQTSIRVSAGMTIGSADGFDIALHDFNGEQQALARPERYHRNNYARASLFNVSPQLLDAITPDHTKARCALDYLRAEDREAWSRKLGDAWGIRRAKGENACRTALIDLPGTAQGAWFTDAAHNGATTKISAVALAPDTINPDRLIFALHGRLTSLTKSMVGTPSISRDGTVNGDPTEIADADFVTFRKGTGLINRSFDEIRDDQIYCYEDLRVNFIGPRINGVLLVQKSMSDDIGDEQIGDEDVLRIEARPDINSCVNVPLNTSLTSKATGFFR